MAELSETINLDEIAVSLPSRIHEVTARPVAKAPTGSRWSKTGLPGATAIWISVSARSLPSSRHWGSGREAVLSSHKDVVQSIVVGRAAHGNEEIVAFVQLLPGSRLTPEELMSFIRFQLTSYKRPSEIVILDALPATSTGKILKHKLAESLRGEGGEIPRRGRPISWRAFIPR